MTREQAIQSIARDRVLNPHQGGSYRIQMVSDNDYEAQWKDPGGVIWRISYEGTRAAWGLASLGG